MDFPQPFGPEIIKFPYVFLNSVSSFVKFVIIFFRPFNDFFNRQLSFINFFALLYCSNHNSICFICDA